MAIQHILHLRCVVCGEKYPADNRYTCDKCGVTGILDVEYDYEKVAQTLTRHALAQRPWTHWRYEELLPVDFTLPLPALQYRLHARVSRRPAWGMGGGARFVDQG